MIVLLNLLPWIVTALLCCVAYHCRSWKPLIVVALFWVLYTALQPSYMPKGEIKRTAPPSFEQTDAVVQDKLLKHTPADVLEQQRKEAIKSGPIWAE